MWRRRLGRLLRGYSPTARCLTEFRLWQGLREDSSSELAYCQLLSEPGSRVLDVGANVGTFSLAMSKAVGRAGQVLALEPNPTVFCELERSLWRSNVKPICAAASDHVGSALLSMPLDAAGGARDLLGTLESKYGDGEQVKVELVTVDGLISSTTPATSLIKIDVEGHELEVLSGAEGLIVRDFPAVVMEIEDRHLAQGRQVEDVVHWMLSRGYVCAGLQGKGLLPWSQFDVDRDQRQWLLNGVSDEPNLGRAEYVNNFVFLRNSHPLVPRLLGAG